MNLQGHQDVTRDDDAYVEKDLSHPGCVQGKRLCCAGRTLDVIEVEEVDGAEGAGVEEVEEAVKCFKVQNTIEVRR